MGDAASTMYNRGNPQKLSSINKGLTTALNKDSNISSYLQN